MSFYDAIFNFNKFNKNFILQEYGYKDDEYKKINEIFAREIENKKYDKQNYTQVSKIYTKKTISTINDNDKYIAEIAPEYLENCGLKQNQNYFMIEFWRYRLFGENKEHKFSKHRDSFGALDDGVNTCIFYLRKDKTFKGGDLEIHGMGDIFRTRCLQTIKPNINILCFDGDIYHKVTDFSGFGIRDCIVVQFGKADTVLSRLNIV